MVFYPIIDEKHETAK